MNSLSWNAPLGYCSSGSEWKYIRLDNVNNCMTMWYVTRCLNMNMKILSVWGRMLECKLVTTKCEASIRNCWNASSEPRRTVTLASTTISKQPIVYVAYAWLARANVIYALRCCNNDSWYWHTKLNVIGWRKWKRKLVIELLNDEVKWTYVKERDAFGEQYYYDLIV